jgi:hypothetical protein
MLTFFGLAVATAAATQPDPLAAIAAYNGTWRTEVEQFESEFSKAGKSTRIIANECWRTAVFYACAQTVNGEHSALLVFTWNESAKVYTTYPIPPDGGTASKGILQIEGDNWYYPWEQEKDGIKLHFRVVNHFLGPDTIEYRQEFSRDGTQWNVIGKGIEHRQSAAVPTAR